MSKKFLYFWLTFVLITSLTNCKKTETTNTNTNNSSSTTTQQNTATSNTEAAMEGTKVETNTNAPSIPVNVTASPNEKLPQDVPIFPNSSPVDKRQTNKITTFIFSTDAITTEVENFYKDALKKEGWIWRLEQQNVADGLLFLKPKRTVRVVAYRDGEKKKTMLRLSLYDGEKNAEPESIQVMGQDGKPVKRIMAANLNEVGKMPLNLAATTPLYPGIKPKATDKPGIWWEYKSSDPVKKIADWYDKELKALGWTVELNTSELGDSMIIYTRTNEKGDKEYEGIRVNDMKEKNERWITLINYPYNATIPHLKPISEVEKEQPEAAKLAKDLAKKNDVKSKILPNQPASTDIDEKQVKEIQAQIQATREKRAGEIKAKQQEAEKRKAEYGKTKGN